ncbi:hypothetical protein J2Z83_000739 [Virgibacillus natechei]|uniref:DUF4352 domain-containing protein n=2 Tax=Virgibacillus natechei TaxID=1216297 RepID=A0ABS4ICI1_9BACI|nr:hypothetical protein [Virgibacillus natechei]
MKQFIKLSLLFTLALILVVGCSNNEDDDQTAGEEDNNKQETSTVEEDEDSEVDDSSEEESSDSNDTHIEHQKGLKMGETGIVEDNGDNKYEVTLNSVEYVDVVGGLDSEGETHAVANMTVKNIGDNNFNAKNIYEPGFGPDGELQSSLNSVLMDVDDVEEDLLEGEIAPGESATGDHVFVVEEKHDNYLFIIGGSGHQIITYANWDVPESEVE